MKPFNLIFILTVALLFTSCNGEINRHNPQISISGFSVRDVKHDTINRFTEKGQQGHWIIFKDSLSGIPVQEGNFIDGKKQGVWRYYDANGSVSDSIEYKDDVPVKK